jgi:hypothetical protein
MRPIFALAILMVGLKGVVPETLYQDALVTAAATPSVSPALSPAAGSVPSIEDTNHEFVLSAPTSPSASSDAPHDQGEDAIEAPQSPAPASTDVDAEAEAAASVDELCNALLMSAEDNDLPVPFFANLIWQESRLRLNAVSPVGALGIAQFMPKVAVEVGLDNPFDPHQAIPASARFLHALREHFGNLGLAAAAYNAGAHRVAEWLDHGRSLPRETRIYVARVTGRPVEAWQKSPPDTSQLTFARPLPCRELPAFAELEQAQAAEHTAKLAQQQWQREKTALQIAKDVAQKIVHRLTSKLAQKMANKAPLSHRLVAERTAIRTVARSGTANKMARNFHDAKHEAAHRAHAHERRRVA